METAHTSQLKKKKNQKVSRRPKQTFLKKKKYMKMDNRNKKYAQPM